MSDRVLENLLAGYALVDALLAAGADVFAMGHLRNPLELNTIALCGTDPARREQYAGPIVATERRDAAPGRLPPAQDDCQLLLA
jgi:hypothetical protein